MSSTSEIMRRCSEIDRLTKVARTNLDLALAQAWEVGRLLESEHKRVRRTMGRSAWSEWLRLHFPKSPEVARRYMRLAQEHVAPESVSSLRCIDRAEGTG